MGQRSGAAALPLLAALALSACTGAIPAFDPLPAVPPAGAHVALTYLGSGGWLIERGGDRIATAPFVSHPRWYALLSPSAPKAALIERVVPEMRGVEILLVGHGHYDHSMDLPHVASTRAREARIYGSRTVTNQLAPEFVRLGLSLDRLREIRAGEVAVGDAPGTWLYNAARTIRFMALRSTHAPHVLGIKLLPSAPVDAPLGRAPPTPASWSEGETLAYVIDFLGPGERPEFRLYYQDSAARPGTGILPRLEGADARPTDVAILCVAAFDQVPDNPEHILASVRPRAVIGGHWEDFFRRGYDDPVRPVLGTSLERFRDRARAAGANLLYLPRPLETLHVPVRNP